ncbi:hypothetical protein PanWU01x14_119790 [Parasponia andersonii]|uniref:Uncharacterized protein n=1 Tax=Parasponia andersonii TaxID=3476 RepID=A0A2P5CVI7_PARAD|nr:hypothetical protein PanWU01x14_119790 [Parasponia andersonii]
MSPKCPLSFPLATVSYIPHFIKHPNTTESPKLLYTTTTLFTIPLYLSPNTTHPPTSHGTLVACSHVSGAAALLKGAVRIRNGESCCHKVCHDDDRKSIGQYFWSN